MSTPANSDKKTVFTFGEYTVDTAHRELRRAGEPVVMQPRVYDLVEAMELAADVAVKRGDPAQAAHVYAAALSRLQERSWNAKETEIRIKLAEVLLDGNDLRGAEPLIGMVTQQPQSYDSLKLRARFAHARGDSG